MSAYLAGEYGCLSWPGPPWAQPSRSLWLVLASLEGCCLGAWSEFFAGPLVFSEEPARFVPAESPLALAALGEPAPFMAVKDVIFIQNYD